MLPSSSTGFFVFVCLLPSAALATTCSTASSAGLEDVTSLIQIKQEALEGTERGSFSDLPHHSHMVDTRDYKSDDFDADGKAAQKYLKTYDVAQAGILNHSGVLDSSGFIAQLKQKATATLSYLGEKAHDLQDQIDAVATVVVNTGAQAARNLTTLAVKITPEDFIRGLIQTNFFQRGLEEWLTSAPFFEMLAWDSDTFTAAACGMAFDATIKIGVKVKQKAAFRRLRCGIKCQQRLSKPIGEWLLRRDDTSTAVRKITGNINEMSANVIKSMIDLPALLKDKRTRNILISELAKSPGLFRAATPARLEKMFGKKGDEGVATLVVQPTLLAGHGIKAQVTRISRKSGAQAPRMRPTDNSISGRIQSFLESAGANIIPWVMNPLMDGIFEALHQESQQLESEVLLDRVMFKLVNALVSGISIDASAMSIRFPAKIVGLQAPEDTEEEEEKRRNLWKKMDCPAQVQKAKGEQMTA
jgi:hypothetical protein